MKKTIILSIAAALMFNSSLFAEHLELSLDFSGKTELNSAVRSMLMPGWGQHYNEQTTKALVVFGLFGACLAGAFYYNNEAFSTYDKYKNYGVIDGKYYSDYESQYLTSQIFTFAAIGVWLYGMIDAYVTAKSGAVTTASKVNFYYSKSSDAYYLSYSKKI